jgi:YD repeat-containing protein
VRLSEAVGITKDAYDSVGNRTSVTDPLARSAYFGYDSLNRLACTTDPLSAVTVFTYDENGNLLSVLDAEGNSTYYELSSLVMK